LSQRIVARYHMRPLPRAEIAEYVQHRLAMAGGRPEILPARLGRRLHAVTRGVPRAINLLCDRALLDASTRGQDEVDLAGLTRSAQELGLASAVRRPAWMQPSWAVAAIGALTVLTTAVTLTARDRHGAGTPAAAASTPATVSEPALASPPAAPPPAPQPLSTAG
jgi:general secretion pathway protein A